MLIHTAKHAMVFRDMQAKAARLQRPQSYVSRCESGLHRIDIFELQEFVRVYQKPLTYFLEALSNRADSYSS